MRPYPISIEWPNRWAIEAAASRRVPARRCSPSWGCRPDAKLGVGRRSARLHEGHRGAAARGGAAPRALPAPARPVHLRAALGARAARSSTATASSTSAWTRSRRASTRASPRGRWRPIVLLRAHHEPPAIFRYLRAADVCYVSSLHDGMNLVAKEFVAARDDERGVLVLSRFTGAARELTEALLVNPYDLEEASAALATALAMPLDEQAARMRAMRAFVAELQRVPLGGAHARGRGAPPPARPALHPAQPGPAKRPRGEALNRDLLSAAARPALSALAHDRALLAFDFDGTLAPIVDEPAPRPDAPGDARAPAGGGAALPVRRRLRPLARGSRPAPLRRPARRVGRQPRRGGRLRPGGPLAARHGPRLARCARGAARRPDRRRDRGQGALASRSTTGAPPTRTWRSGAIRAAADGLPGARVFGGLRW